MRLAIQKAVPQTVIHNGRFELIWKFANKEDLIAAYAELDVLSQFDKVQAIVQHLQPKSDV